MKTDIQTANEAVTPSSRELTILKKYFPQCFSKPDTDENGNIIKEHFDIEKLTELLNKDEVDIKKEGFTLNFLGKSYAHYQSNLDSETVIVPDEKNAESDSENVYIVGDNLDALQHLKYSYAEKIKCIYIDPPYNTGKDDFVYNDKFGFTAKELVEKLDVSEEEAERICSMNGKCTHSAWLTFMYPRLALARELLREDGVIFISIDDNEQANLKRLCDEVFGEGNFICTFIWKKRQMVDSRTKNGASKDHDYLLCYGKNEFVGIRGMDSDKTKYKNPDNDPRGDWMSADMTGLATASQRPNLHYDLTDPSTGIVYPCPATGWRYEPKRMAELIEHKEILFPNDNTKRPRRKKFLKDVESEFTGLSSILDTVYSTQGTRELRELFDDNEYFDFPKPVNYIKLIIQQATSSNPPAVGISNPCDNSDIILDFFSGSGTTAHAVMDLNANDNGKRKFIMVQLNEPVKKGSEAEKAGYKTIDEIGRERIRRAAAKIKAEHPDTSADLGFKTYYLKSMPKETLDKIKTFDPNAIELISSKGDIVKSLGEKTLLQTWQIKDGFGFNAVPQKIDLSGYTAYLLDNEKIGKYLYLLDEIEEKSIKELIRKIESLELTVDKIFIYGYSFDFNMLTSITTNLKTLKNRNPLEPIVRY
ncbi:MAG: site-specific DNA-methyltransferase [Treponema sp.]|nr:site-specific DNA-methyltransferase [Treponema sp.]